MSIEKYAGKYVSIQVELLREIEWSAWSIDEGYCCPVCEGMMPTKFAAGGHEPDCWLAEALK
jgi:hypothetical protein